MSANRPDNETNNTTTGAGTPGTGSSSSGTGSSSATTPTGGAGSLTRGTSPTGSTGGGGATGASTGTAAATGLAQQYGQKIADAASSAKDYVTEKAGVVGEKFQDLRNKDYGQMAEDAKQYARQNPGQALLISAAAGFLLGILIRGSRR